MPEIPPQRPVTAFEEGRRAARARGEVTETEAVAEPAETSTTLRPAREGAGGGDLARAFHANAEALRGLGALQAQLLEALQRNDRSELVLASTQGLNESFRHLTLIQRELLGRLERGGEQVQRAGRAVPLLLLGLVAVVVLATYVLVDLGQQFIDRNDPRGLTDHAVARMQEVRDEATRTTSADLERSRAEVAAAEERRQALERQLDQERLEHAQAQRDLGAREAELEGLRRQFGAAQNQALTIPSLESEIKDLTLKVASGEPRLKQLEQDLDEARRENGRLRRRIAGSALGMPDEEVASAPPAVPAPRAPEPARAPPSAPAAPEGPAPSAVPPPEDAAAPRAEAEGGVTDPRVLADVRTRLNQLLEAAGNRRADYWQVMRVDALGRDRLQGVILTRYASDGRVLERIEAREAQVWVERDQRRVVIDVRQGERVVAGQRTALPEGKVQTVVAEGEAITQIFAASGLRLIGSR